MTNGSRDIYRMSSDFAEVVLIHQGLNNIVKWQIQTTKAGNVAFLDFENVETGIYEYNPNTDGISRIQPSYAVGTTYTSRFAKDITGELYAGAPGLYKVSDDPSDLIVHGRIRGNWVPIPTFDETLTTRVNNLEHDVSDLKSRPVPNTTKVIYLDTAAAYPGGSSGTNVIGGYYDDVLSMRLAKKHTSGSYNLEILHDGLALINLCQTVITAGALTLSTSVSTTNYDPNT